MRGPVPEQHRSVASDDIGQLLDTSIGGVEELRRGNVARQLQLALIRGCCRDRCAALFRRNASAATTTCCGKQGKRGEYHKQLARQDAIGFRHETQLRIGDGLETLPLQSVFPNHAGFCAG